VCGWPPEYLRYEIRSIINRCLKFKQSFLLKILLGSQVRGTRRE
jgi:hypothetical protein